MLTVKSISKGQDIRTLVSPGRPPPWTLVVEEMAVDWRMFWTKVSGRDCGETNCCTLEKSIVCATSVRMRPCDVFTQPARTNWREEVVVTVPVTVPVVGSVFKTAFTAGEGVPIVFWVTAPVTCVER